MKFAAFGFLAAGALVFFAGHGTAKADSFTLNYIDASGPHAVAPVGGVYDIPNTATSISVSGQITGSLVDVYCDKFADDQSFNEDLGNSNWAVWNVDNPTLISTFSLWSFSGQQFTPTYVQHATGNCNYPSPPVIGNPYIVNYSFSFPIASYTQGVNHKLFIDFYSAEGSGLVCATIGDCIPQESAGESVMFDIVPPAPPTVISVAAICSPTTLQLVSSGSQPNSSCSATVTYSDGSTDSNVTWSAAPASAGSISPSGLYTPVAGGAGGTVTVTAISNIEPSKTGSAFITILPAAGSVTIKVSSVNSVDGSAVSSQWIVTGGPGVSFPDGGTSNSYSEPASPAPYAVNASLGSAGALYALDTVSEESVAQKRSADLGGLLGLRWLVNTAEGATVCSAKAPAAPSFGPPCSPIVGSQTLSNNGDTGNFLITWDPVAQISVPGSVALSDTSPTAPLAIENSGATGSTLNWSISSVTYSAGASGWLNITPKTNGTLSAGSTDNLTAHATGVGSMSPGSYSATVKFTGTSDPGGIPVTSQSVVVNLNIGSPAPAVSIRANPTSVGLGGTTSLIWNSTSTTGCTASAVPAEADWNGSVGTGGVTTVKPGVAGSTTYKLQCAAVGGGTVSDSVSVSVTAAVGPLTLSINIGPPAVAAIGVPVPVVALAGGNPCTDCTWSAPGSSPSSGNGSTIQVEYPSTGTQTVTATNSADGNSTSTSVDILNDCSLTSSPTSIVVPGQSVLAWSCPYLGNVDVATSCNIKKSDGTQIDSFSVSVAAASGTDYVSPTNTETYTLFCAANNGLSSQMPTSTAIVTVQGPGIHETNP